MAIVRWDPFSRWPGFPEDWERSLFQPFEQEKGLDVYEEDDSIVVKANLPGIPEDNIDVTVDDGVLCIRGEYEEKDEDSKKRKYYRREAKRSYYYSTALPSAGNLDKIEADVKNGVVTVRIPKAESAKPKRIKIKKAK